jgi:NADPH:quinone reductase-like Zn-dependent oxidoreductase
LVEQSPVRAILYERYGPPEVLELEDIPKPTPKDHEVLIKVRATTVTAMDWRLRSLSAPKGFGILMRLAMGPSKPRRPILGAELSGEIEAIGKAVSRFKVGDQLFAGVLATYVEYKCMREDGPLALKPANLSYEEAAALSFGGTTALAIVRKGKIEAGQSVLVNGASGAVGTAAVQLAKHHGARVTGVCSTANLELVKSLGADEVIDYTAQDFARRGQAYDVIVDNVGNAPFSRTRDALKPGGRLLLVVGTLSEMLMAPWVSMGSGKRVVVVPARARAEDLRLLASLAESGRLKPVIDRSYPFEQMVEAHRYVDTGRKRGNVVLTL